MAWVELIPGKRFEEVVRPVGLGAFPYRVTFERLHAVECKLTHTVRRHRHGNYEIMLIVGGSYVCTINDQRCTLHRNGVAVLKPGDWHEDLCSSPVEFMSLTLKVQPGPDATTSASVFSDAIPPAAQAFATAGHLHAIAARMRAEGGHADPFSPPLLDALAFEFICALLRSMPSAYINPKLLDENPHHAFATALLTLFDRSLGSPLGLGDMAKHLAMSERSLSARCRAAFKTSPTRLFVRFKMERARTLLMQTDTPIKEISRYLGFENPYHFSTVYKRVHGFSPAHHRC